jgi:adenine-specific DNA-methyltransferase
MNLNILTPRKALNKAYLKVKPHRNAIESFKVNLIKLLDQINEVESEEFHKNIISDFLKDTYYKDNHFINTKGRNDLVIHNGKDAKSTVGVIVEAKKPANKSEMIRADNINIKAFQELILYYLRERITLKNLEIKYLIVTNIHEWFIFDAQLFERLFAHNKTLVKQFTDFEDKRLSGISTDFFYKEIAETFIKTIESEITFTYFDIRNYEKPLRNVDKQDDNKLIALYKLFSPEHLLKLPFANDSNSLNKSFYTELLHIIGLVETKEGGKKLIGRKKEEERNKGALMENAIIQLESLDKISRLENAHRFGETNGERLFNVSLALSITWINRILFLKLLEAQLIKYNKGDKSFSFLNLEKVQNYDDLNSLFFSVLARKTEERNSEIIKLFARVPYLNSSLFEPTEIEHTCLFISQLSNKKLPLLNATVLRDKTGMKRTGEIDALEYLFDFLDAYDFAGEGAEEIQEDNKTLINASVLGLIFEKINGYKDGSFFTPGFITMYMCRETIRRAVVQKFNEAKKWDCQDINQLYNKIEDKKEANSIINSLKICDPAVGSGHFLVSALNEIIAIKNDLKILSDREGKRLKEYSVEVVNDELMVTDEDGKIFEYNPTNKESQRIQETLFHEKETIIENCLFGVDINPNSVKICRLRLWIELLKNAYYKAPDFAELETLPNIDINIKCGNSLISRYSLDADIKEALRHSKWSIDSYRLAIMTYRNAQNKGQKQAMEKLINEIKSDFEIEVAANDKRAIRLKKRKDELKTHATQTHIFELTKAEKADWEKKLKKLTADIAKLEAELEEIKSNKIYENAFEWRFEFPEVLTDEGYFVGFDVVIGNPPYIVIKGGRYTGYELNQNVIEFLKKNYVTGEQQINTYTLFFELSNIIVNSKNSYCSLIIPNTFLANEYSLKLRKYLLDNFSIQEIYNTGLVFEDANVETAIVIYSKGEKTTNTNIRFRNKTYPVNLIELANYTKDKKFLISLNKEKSSIIAKLNILPKLSNYAKIWRGLTTGNDKNYLSPSKLDSRYKPLIIGSDIEKYVTPVNSRFVLYIPEELDRARDERIFLLPEKLISKFVGVRLNFTIDFNKNYVLNSCCVTELIDNNYSIKALLGLLNSSLLNFYFKNVFTDYRETFPIMKSGNIEDLPIVELSQSSQNRIENIVDKVLKLKQTNPSADISVLEKEIDQLVYKLYGLTDEEIAIVEGHN